MELKPQDILVLFKQIAQGDRAWTHATLGEALQPLCRNAPDAALADPALYTLLALQDALRMGRARERDLAAKHMERIVLGQSDAR